MVDDTLMNDDGVFIGWKNTDLATQAVRVGQLNTEYGAHSEPIFTTSSFVFESAKQAAARFSGSEPGCIYSRFTNPTVQSFEQRLAALEGAERCVATASGMSAILTLCLALLKQGDQVVCARQVFGSSVGLFNNIVAKFGVAVHWVDLADLDQWAQVVAEVKPVFVFFETPSNPLSDVADIPAIAKIVHDQGGLLVVDNCFCTPALQKPLSLGADIIIHSATKFIEGQGRTVGGALCGSDALMQEMFQIVRTAGPAMSPFNAWVALKGLETLSIRMQAQSAAAMTLAHWLSQQDAVKKVYYTGLPDHPQHELAKRQQSAFGAVLAFEVEGGREAAWRVIDNTRIFSITANLGDVKSTITHPATTTHHKLSPEDKVKAGISEGLIRLSVGLESVADLKADLLPGLVA